MPKKIALLIIDLQVDFAMPHGKLYVQGGENTIKPTEKLVELARENDVMVVFSCDQHHNPDPEFKKWPPHCIAGSYGAQMLIEPRENEVVIAKGSFEYSAFSPCLSLSLTHSSNEDLNRSEDRHLAIALNKAKIDTLILTGLAYDFCVGETALDATMSGFDVYVVNSCTRSVRLPTQDGKSDSEKDMQKKLKDRKVNRLSFKSAVSIIKGE